MDLLCDRNVADKYYRAFRQADWLSVWRLREVLPIDAPDGAIIDYAREHGLVIFTSDVRFLADDDPRRSRQDITVRATNCGVLFYRQTEDPSPGDIVAAIREISRSYEVYSEIREFVPGDWI